MSERRAIFLDRDGVIVEDVDWLVETRQIKIMPGAPQALRRLDQAGFLLLVVTNQPVVARGWATEAQIEIIHGALNDLLAQAGAPRIEKFYYCPHHPQANLPAYRQDCECRKPRPGMILQGAKDYSVDLAKSFIVGDRISDIVAGHKAGLRTVHVQTGKHLEPPIQSTEKLDADIRPEWVCADLSAATDWILTQP